MTKIISEKLLERKLGYLIKKRGGLAIKLNSFSYTGLPDRLVLCPGAVIAFAEIKTTGKKPSPRQVIVIKILRMLGFHVFIVDNFETLDELIRYIDHAI